MDAIFLTQPLNNSTRRKKFENEAISISNKLEEVNTSFLWHLFNSDSDMSYEAIYEHHLKWWRKMVQACYKWFKPQTCAINEYFFEDNYKPII